MADSNNKRWLLISGAPIQQALWKPLAQRYNLCFVYDGVNEYAESVGVKAENLNRYITAEVTERSLNEAAHFAAKSVKQMPIIHQRFTERLNGNTPDSIKESSDWFPGYLLQKSQQIAMMVGAVDVFSSTHDIAGCVVHEDVAPDMRAIVAISRAHGWPTIHLPHAPCHLRDDGGPDIHRHTRAEWIGASGPRVAEFYRDNGHDPSKITIVGGSQWDGLYNSFTHVDRVEARRVLDIPIERIALWYGATWYQTTALRGGYESELKRGLMAVIDVVKRMNAWLMITLHPNDGTAAEKYFSEALKEENIDGLVTRFHIPYIAAAADALIAQGPSNLCLDAAVQGVPSCYLQTDGFDYRSELPYRSQGDALEFIVRKTLDSRDNPRWQDFVSEYNVAHPDGNASERIAEWIGELCQ